MKYIYILFFMVNVNLISAQDLRLFENTWYLTKIVSNGIDYYPPTNPEFSSLPLTFNQQNSYLSAFDGCNTLSGFITFENNLTNFILNHYYTTLRLCYFSPFELQYSSVFENGAFGERYSYLIDKNGMVKTLTITNLTDNDQAIYSNQNLATVDFKELDFKVYSDTSANFIVVELKKINTKNVSLEIFDSLGKKIKSKSFYSNEFKISTEDLSNGVYIVKITSENQVGIKKFIKS